eukprot:scaffold23486_cov25-Tisochrysis_lutea.AAC.2
MPCRYLEAMTARLVSATDQLLAPFERGIPHAALIPAQPLGESSGEHGCWSYACTHSHEHE